MQKEGAVSQACGGKPNTGKLWQTQQHWEETSLVLGGSGQSCNGREGVHECKFFGVRRMKEKPEFAQAVPFSERSWRSCL